jgi:A/G-specific adenine glycosylase
MATLRKHEGFPFSSLYKITGVVSAHGMTPFAHALIRWFTANARPLPWRATYDPYHVWLAEVMAQQTQMDRVVPYFTRFVCQIPHIPALAAAPEALVLKLWEGLGYYRRAHHLMACARVLCQDFGGELPRHPQLLRRLPGIGPYVAAAIASIAYNQDVPVVDANVLRVVARLRAIRAPITAADTRQTVETFCREHLPPGQARLFNQGLMELGALVCTPRQPRCHTCPVAPQCRAAQDGTTQDLPVRPPRLQVIRITMATGLIWHQGRVLVQKRRMDDVWGGLWEFPGGVVEAGERPEAAVCREIAEETGLTVEAPQPLGVFRHSYMQYRVTLHAFAVHLVSDPNHLTLTEAETARWATWDEVRALPFPAGHRKLVQALSRKQAHPHRD